MNLRSAHASLFLLPFQTAGRRDRHLGSIALYAACLRHFDVTALLRGLATTTACLGAVSLGAPVGLTPRWPPPPTEPSTVPHGRSPRSSHARG